AAVFGPADVGAEADALPPQAAVDDAIQSGEGPATDEQDVGGVDLDKLLVGVLAATLGRYRRGGALQDLEQGLLHPFPGHVPGDRGVFALAGDLVDLVDVDDPGLGLLDVVISGLDQLQEDVFDVLTHVTGLGEGGGVRDGEGNVEHPRQRLGQEGLAAARGPEQQNVRFLKLYFSVSVPTGLDPLVVVVNRHRQDLLGPLLPDDIVVEKTED